MMKRLLPIVLGTLMLGCQAIAAQSPPTRGATTASDVEAKAKNLRSPDRDQIKALTRAVLADDGIIGPVADNVAPLTTVLAEAEYQFHAGNLKPIREHQVIKVFNSIASKLNAPQYAYTTRFEIRSLRVRMATETPHLIGRRSINKPLKRKGDDLSLLDDAMSPLEAVHVLTTMMYQKMLNPAYQMTDDERVERRKHQRTQPASLTKEEARVRFQEMHSTVSNAINTPGFSLLQFTTDSMASLVAGQTGGN